MEEYAVKENKGTTNNQSVQKDEIDDFAKALLDKKTEMALFKDMPKKENNKFDENARLEAEKTMSSALDMLRKERGQKPIQLEEQEYTKTEFNVELDDDLDDFTTYSLGKEDLMNASIKNVQGALEEEKEVPEESNEEKVKEPKPKKEVNKKRKYLIIGAIVGLVAVLMAGYAYKIYVYDPQNTITEQMQASYDKFIAYADEWDMMSDSEKLELLDMKDEYDSLVPKQHDALNAYFKEQIGKDYKTIYKELKQLKKEQEDENNPDYQEIVAYLTNWASKNETEKMNILNLKTKYDALSNGLQKKVDDLSRQQSSKSFGALFTEFDKIKKDQEEEARRKAEQEKNEKIAYYQSLINQTKVELENYTAYKTTLESELASAQANGQDTSEIQSQIDMNNQLIDQCNANIQNYEAEIAKYK